MRCLSAIARSSPQYNARYSPHYKITPAELEWLTERVELLQTLVKEACEARLAPRD